MTRRLFIFAAYDKDGIVDDTLLWYLNALSDLGDIVFTMDNDVAQSELVKVEKIPNVLHATATCHGEYDFGSYKRGYMWADEQKILKKYDWVYLVNDSVYGPLWDIKTILKDLESRGVDLTGMTSLKNPVLPAHIQSWFVGLSQKISTCDFFKDFMTNVTHLSDKNLIISQYEIRLSQIIIQHGYQLASVAPVFDNEICYDMYKSPLDSLKKGVPFIKKSAVCKINGKNLLYPFTSAKYIDYIYANASRTNILAKTIIPHIKCFRLAILGLPIFSIYRQFEPLSKTISYKIYLFDHLRFMKISRLRLCDDKCAGG